MGIWSSSPSYFCVMSGSVTWQRSHVRLEQCLGDKRRSKRSTTKESPVQAFCGGPRILQLLEFEVHVSLSKVSLIQGLTALTHCRHLVDLDSPELAILAFNFTLDVLCEVQVPVAFGLSTNGLSRVSRRGVAAHSSGLNMLLTER